MSELRHCIIPGAPRSGTTALFRYLASHPDVAGSRKKELNFFMQTGSLNAYLREFSLSDATQLTLEASPTYYRNMSTALPRLSSLLPNVRLLHLLREPRRRLFAYFQGVKTRKDWLAPEITFDDYVNVVVGETDPSVLCPNDLSLAQHIYDGRKVGFYADILSTFLTFFPMENMSIQFNEHLAANPNGVLIAVCRFLGLDPTIYENFSFNRENQNISPHSLGLYRTALRLNAMAEPLLNQIPSVRTTLRRLHNSFNAGGQPRVHASQEAMGKLSAFYRPHNQALFELMKQMAPVQELPEWVTGLQ